MTYPIFSQRDPMWAAYPLGMQSAEEDSTIGAYGCAITCIAQKLTVMGFMTTPLYIQAAFRAHSVFGGRTHNLVTWSLVPSVISQFEYGGRVDYPDQKVPRSIMTMISDRLSRQNPVILYVDASPYAAGLQQHFVLAIEELESGIQILNPWNGKRQDLRPYGKTDEIAICGAIWLDVKFDAKAAI